MRTITSFGNVLEVHGNPLIYIINGSTTTGKSLFRYLIQKHDIEDFFIHHLSYTKTGKTFVVPENVKFLFISGNMTEDDMADFQQFKCREICLVRDFRISCLCSTEFTMPTFDLEHRLDNLFEKVDYIDENLGNKDFHLLKYEDWISGKDIGNIFTELEPNIFENMDIDVRFNGIVTKTDLDRITKSVGRFKFKYFDTFFPLVSERTVKYNERFGYDKNLNIRDIFLK